MSATQGLLATNNHAYDAQAIIIGRNTIDTFLNSAPSATHSKQRYSEKGHPSIPCGALEQQLLTTLQVSLQDGACSGHIQQTLLTALLAHLTTKQPSITALLKQATDTPFSEKVSHFLEAQLDQPITLPMLATHLSLSISSVKRKLAQEGLSFSQMLQHKRAYKGATILRSGRSQINAVAKQCGFSSAAQFSHTFKNVYGCTPKVFRKERRTP
ncbi:AraC family transcriptional regulator [Vibrio rarus]